MEIFSDDVSGAIPAAKRARLFMMRNEYDCLTIAIDDDGLVRARISENGSMSSLVSDVSIRDDQWHHLVVTFGDSPKSFKMYLDGLLNGDPSIHSSGVISLHLEDPSSVQLTVLPYFPVMEIIVVSLMNCEFTIEELTSLRLLKYLMAIPKMRVFLIFLPSKNPPL